MNINIRAKDFELTRAIDRFVRSHLRAALTRIDEDVVSIDIFLKDENGPRGGVDKQLLIHVRMRNRQQIAVVAKNADMYAAIMKGVKRTKRAVRRHTRKSRHFQKQRMRDMLKHGAPGALGVD